jgi:hypothetical protein
MTCNPRVRFAIVTALALTLLAGSALAASHEDKVKQAAAPAREAAKADPAADAMAEQMAQLSRPGKAHEGFKSWVGKWKQVTRGWYAPGEPSVTEGTSENTLIMGGRFVQQEFRGSMMGQPFEGLGLTGYDNLSGKYTMVWIDNSATTIVSAANGVMDEAAKTLTFTSKVPGADGGLADCRMVTKFVSDREHVFTMFVATPQGDHKMMEITYTKL